MGLFEKIQQAAQGQVESLGIKFVLCPVTGVNPLKLKIHDALELTKEFFIFPQHLEEDKLEVMDSKTTASTGGDICSGNTLSEVIRQTTLQPKLQIGDRLMVLVIGSDYIILDKVGDSDGSNTYTAK